MEEENVDDLTSVASTIFTCDHSAATDFTHEALRLFEEEPRTAENAQRLQDEKAHALLWHYICNLEKKLQEVSNCYSLRNYCCCESEQEV